MNREAPRAPTTKPPMPLVTLFLPFPVSPAMTRPSFHTSRSNPPLTRIRARPRSLRFPIPHVTGIVLARPARRHARSVKHPHMTAKKALQISTSEPPTRINRTVLTSARVALDIRAPTPRMMPCACVSLVHGLLLAAKGEPIPVRGTDTSQSHHSHPEAPHQDLRVPRVSC